MILKRFNNESYIEVNGEGGAAKEVSSLGVGQVLSGEGDFFGGDLVALYVRDAKIFIRAKDAILDTLDSSLVIKYEHLDGGGTQFYISGVGGSVRIVYESWWKNFPLASPAYEYPEDKERDFCAFVIYVINNSEAKKTYIKEFS